MTLPAGPDALDAAWLEDVLRRGGAFPSARVRRVSAEVIGAGYGWVSTIARVTLDGDGAPASVVAKWCSKADADREARFRREVAPHVDVATADVFGVSLDDASDRALLLLEDVRPARQGDFLLAVAHRDAEVLVDAMIALHAPFWNRADDAAVAWLPPWRLGTDVADRVRRTDAAVAPFLDRWSDRLSLAARDAVRALPSRLPAACDALARAPSTLVHADFHIENVLFRADGTPVVLDWTDVSRGAAAVDFARFLLNARDGRERRDLRRAAAPRYVRGLAAGGVAGYGLDALTRDVAHALTVALALEVRTTVRTDVARPSHPHFFAVVDLQVLGTAEAAADFEHGVRLMHLVLFDVDGTLLDNPGGDDARYLRAFDAAFGIRGIDTDWSRYPNATDSCITRELLARHFGRPATDDEIGAARAAYVAELHAAVASGENVGPTMRGALDALAAMSADGWSAAIATGGWRASALLKLERSRLPVMSLPGAFADDHITREGIASIARQRAEAAAGLAATRVVYVGDATWDVKACAALALPFVGIATGGRAERLRRAGATTVIADFADGFLDALDAAVAPTPR